MWFEYFLLLWNWMCYSLLLLISSGQGKCRKSSEVNRQDQRLHLLWHRYKCSGAQQNCSSTSWLGLLQISFYFFLVCLFREALSVLFVIWGNRGVMMENLLVHVNNLFKIWLAFTTINQPYTLCKLSANSKGGEFMWTTINWLVHVADLNLIRLNFYFKCHSLEKWEGQ